MLGLDMLAQLPAGNAEDVGDLPARERGRLRAQEELAGFAIEDHDGQRGAGQPALPAHVGQPRMVDLPVRSAAIVSKTGRSRSVTVVTAAPSGSQKGISLRFNPPSAASARAGIASCRGNGSWTAGDRRMSLTAHC